MTEIALQGQSKGIFYEGYEKQFIQCIFEEGEVQGRNERYEFRCDADLQCCGRVCCVPQDNVIPLWLMIIFIILALLLLLALLGTLAYLCAKRKKEKPKKPLNNSSNRGEYSTLQQKDTSSNNDRALLVQDDYTNPDYYNNRYGRYGNGYRNQGYGDGYGNGYGYGRDLERNNDWRNQYGRGGGAGDGSDTGSVRHTHEVYEESYKEEVQYEKTAGSDSDSREVL